MKSKQKLFNKMALGLFCCLSVPAYSANRGFTNGDFHGYVDVPTGNAKFLDAGTYGWKTNYLQGIEIWNNYLGVTGAKNTNQNAGSGQFASLNKDNTDLLYQNVCFIGNETIQYRFAHRGRGTDFTNSHLTPNPAGETIRLGVFDDNAQLVANFLDATSPRDEWTYYPPRVEGTSWPDPYTPAILFRTLTANYTGPSGIYKLGFQAVNSDSIGQFVDSVYVGLRPAIDLGPNEIIPQTGGNKLYIPLRLNGVLPVTETGAGMGGSIFLKDTGTIPRDKYTLDQPRWGSADWFAGTQGGNPISITWKEANKGWLISFGPQTRRIFDGDDPELYMYIPVTLKEYGDWKVSFELASPGQFGSSPATDWILGGTPQTNPVCEGDSRISIELKPSRSTDQWYSDVSNVYTTPNITPQTLSLSTHYNLMKQIGDVRATKIDQATGAVGAKSERVWSAAEQLNKKDWTTRKIYTTRDGIFPSSQKEPTIVFDERALRSQTETAVFGSSVDNVSDQAAIYYYWNEQGTPPPSELLNYIKGDRSGEGAKFPRRESLLGEVHSGIVTYKDLVYVQTGEGMLHAFDIKTGEEKWAYMPKLYLRSLNPTERQPYGLPPASIKGLLKLFPDDDLAPLNVGKITLARVGKELVLMGTTGGLIRHEATQSSRQPIFYALTIEDASGNVPDIPVARWANMGPCNYSINTTIPNCGQAPVVENWKVGYLNDGPDQVVGFIPSGIAYNGLVRDALPDAKVGEPYAQPLQSSAHVLNVFSVDTGRFTLIYSKREYSGLNPTQAQGRQDLVDLFNRFAQTTFTDVDFTLDSKPLANYPKERAIKDIYVGDGLGYIWRLPVMGKTFQDLYVSPTNQKPSTVAGSTNTYYDSTLNFTPSFIGDKPIYRIKVANQDQERGGVAGAEKGQMILFGTSGNQGIRNLKMPFVDKGVNVIAGYFDAAQGSPVVAGYADLVPQVRKLNSANAKKVYTELTPIDYATKRGWLIELTNPQDGADLQEQVLAPPYLLDSTSALFFTAVPTYTNYETTDVPYGYFMKVNVKTGQIEPDVDNATPPNYIDGVFAAPSIIKNDKTGKTHFNIKYASTEPESESKVGSITVEEIGPKPCIESATVVCSTTKVLTRLSVRELLAY